MYTTHFGLREKPFNITTDPRFFYNNPVYEKAYTDLLSGILEHQGFMILTGEAGTGKTMLLRRLIASSDPKIRFVFFQNTSLSFDDLLSFTCEGLGLEVNDGEYLQKIQVLDKFLVAQLQEGKTIALVIDDAQNQEEEILENLLVLSNHWTRGDKLVQIVLAGLPEFERKLKQPSLSLLEQSIAVRCRLERLQDGEVSAFIRHRLHGVGYERDNLFAPEAIQRIAAYSRGIPRLIDALCGSALHIASLDAQQTVTADVVEEGVKYCALCLTQPGTGGESPLLEPTVEVRSAELTQAPKPSPEAVTAELARDSAHGVVAGAPADPAVAVASALDQESAPARGHGPPWGLRPIAAGILILLVIGTATLIYRFEIAAPERAASIPLPDVAVTQPQPDSDGKATGTLAERRVPSEPAVSTEQPTESEPTSRLAAERSPLGDPALTVSQGSPVYANSADTPPLDKSVEPLRSSRSLAEIVTQGDPSIELPAPAAHRADTQRDLKENEPLATLIARTSQEKEAWYQSEVQKQLIRVREEAEARAEARQLKEQYRAWAETTTRRGERVKAQAYQEKALIADPGDDTLAEALQQAKEAEKSEAEETLAQQEQTEQARTEAFQALHEIIPRAITQIERVDHEIVDQQYPATVAIRANISGPVKRTEVLLATDRGFSPVVMYDDGTHGDRSPDDGEYGTEITLKATSHATRYYVAAYTTKGTVLYSPARAEAETYFIEPHSSTAKSAVVLNEFMASNEQTISDPQGDYDDWIELYNTTPDTIDLSGYYLSDNPEKSKKWRFPDGTKLAGYAYLLVWADHEPSYNKVSSSPPELHANFDLNKVGEHIVLTNTDKNGNSILDSVSFSRQRQDFSMGRLPNGFGEFSLIRTATPGRVN